MRAKLQFLHDMARELAVLSEADGLEVLAYVFRMAEVEAGRMKLSMGDWRTRRRAANVPR